MISVPPCRAAPAAWPVRGLMARPLAARWRWRPAPRRDPPNRCSERQGERAEHQPAGGRAPVQRRRTGHQHAAERDAGAWPGVHGAPITRPGRGPPVVPDATPSCRRTPAHWPRPPQSAAAATAPAVGKAMASVSRVVATRPPRTMAGPSIAGQRPGPDQPGAGRCRPMHGQVAQVVGTGQPAGRRQIREDLGQHQRQQGREGEAADAHGHRQGGGASQRNGRYAGARRGGQAVGGGSGHVAARLAWARRRPPCSSPEGRRSVPQAMRSTRSVRLGSLGRLRWRRCRRLAHR